MEAIQLRLDEGNELIFEVNISGTDSPNAVPKYRFLCESTKMSLTFEGSVDSGKVHVNVSVLKDILKEGRYPARLEVVIDDRYFVPLKMDVEFKNSLKVTAESVTVNKKRIDENKTAEDTQATARLIKNTAQVSTYTPAPNNKPAETATKPQPLSSAKRTSLTLKEKFKKKHHS